MRRLSIALLTAVLFVGFHGTQYVFAVTYAAGWNLVAGPEGSRLSGASGSVFTLQPGDTDYEVFAADSPLHGGYGYWAFFPSGGSITLTGGSNTFSVASVPGQFIMVGNPSQSVVTISGADTAYTYTPSAGYQAATTIPPGQGAWVMGQSDRTCRKRSHGTCGERPGTCGERPGSCGGSANYHHGSGSEERGAYCSRPARLHLCQRGSQLSDGVRRIVPVRICQLWCLDIWHPTGTHCGHLG